MAYDDDDWPEPERDPEKLEAARRSIAGGMRGERRRTVLRWTYAGLAVLLIIVILLAILR